MLADFKDPIKLSIKILRLRGGGTDMAAIRVSVSAFTAVYAPAPKR
jgi:hypothetical protein